MRGIICYIFILSIFISCTNSTKVQEQAINISEVETKSENIPKISLDSMKAFYLEESSHSKDSIMAGFKTLFMNPPMKKGKEFDIDIKEYLNKALKKGDTEAYDLIIYELTMFSESKYLPYAIYMADNHHYDNAYDDVFRYLRALSIRNLDSLISANYINIEDVNRRDIYNLDYISPGQRALALTYLISGAENGSEKLKRVLEDYCLKGKYF
ncbi:hypothetical protein M2451_000662 [Dysgonomonas sp. PFB1-18]|uniref:hypothetical protein n=1 Tax=unclassified Dysgonomonas TaxID=2630389 RepID=UPI0024750D59|nr:MULTISPECIES: hypothetical protein [unclassified Dysgonomonas]MDH6307513.1 hypothetical protein [Dysgonomonas sp. PF1-14]MDH6337431.1 hypothetical protein [Dysgonomonas sp. PF1-16]MDH6379355.1 hypothetical protein [Dysgonomonas sp. PFB1-18]MDH6396007.1 hypothetical protein [Dysgonomonas sp. PF1-23]